MTIAFKIGNIFSSDAEALVNTVNCEGYMGKGLAYQFKQKFPEMEKDYKKVCEAGKLEPGKLHFFKENEKLIINFPTKDKWRGKSRLEFIEKGLKTLRDEIINRNIKSIAIPPLGSGNGGLNWNDVKKRITETLIDVSTEVKIEVYEPSLLIEKDKDEPKSSFKTLYLLCISEKVDNFIFKNLNYSVQLSKILSNNEMIIADLKTEIHRIREIKKYYNTDDNKEIYSIVKNKLVSSSVENLEKKFEPVIDKAVNLVNKYDEETLLFFITTFNLVNMNNKKEIREKIPENIISILFKEGLLKQDIFENIEINYIK